MSMKILPDLMPQVRPAQKQNLRESCGQGRVSKSLQVDTHLQAHVTDLYIGT